MKYYGYIYECTWYDESGQLCYYVGQRKSSDFEQDNYKGSGLVITHGIYQGWKIEYLEPREESDK